MSCAPFGLAVAIAYLVIAYGPSWTAAQMKYRPEINGWHSPGRSGGAIAVKRWAEAGCSSLTHEIDQDVVREGKPFLPAPLCTPMSSTPT